MPEHKLTFLVSNTYLVSITLNLGLISTTGMYHYNKTSTILTTSRVIYAINGEADQLEVRFLPYPLCGQDQ